MSKPTPARYRTTNWSAYNAALRKRGSLLIWLDKEMDWHAPHEGRAGRPPVFSNVAIQFCLSIKVLFKLPLRQTAGMVASLLHLAGLDWPVPDYSTLCRRQKTLKVQIPYRRADGPVNLLVDSTGIKFLGDGEWQARKHGVQGRRQWRKVHLAMDTATSDIRAVEFTPSRDRPRARKINVALAARVTGSERTFRSFSATVARVYNYKFSVISFATSEVRSMMISSSPSAIFFFPLKLVITH